LHRKPLFSTPTFGWKKRFGQSNSPQRVRVLNGHPNDRETRDWSSNWVFNPGLRMGCSHLPKQVQSTPSDRSAPQVLSKEIDRPTDRLTGFWRARRSCKAARDYLS